MKLKNFKTFSKRLLRMIKRVLKCWERPILTFLDNFSLSFRLHQQKCVNWRLRYVHRNELTCDESSIKAEVVQALFKYQIDVIKIMQISHFLIN